MSASTILKERYPNISFIIAGKFDPGNPETISDIYIKAWKNNLKGVTFGNKTFVGIGLSGNIVRSTDNGLQNGASWDNATSQTANNLNGITFSE